MKKTLNFGQIHF